MIAALRAIIPRVMPDVSSTSSIAIRRRDLTLPAGFIAPCLPMMAPRPPSGPLWLHEIKHDGFRVLARNDGGRIRLYGLTGDDLTERFPLTWPSAQPDRF